MQPSGPTALRRVALGRDGTAQIKALLDGDKPLYQEPLY